MGLFTYLSKVAAMVDSAADNGIFLTRSKPAAKLPGSGLGNHTTPPNSYKTQKESLWYKETK